MGIGTILLILFLIALLTGNIGLAIILLVLALVMGLI